ncbi:MAG: CHASE2 domain-containing protein [Planctomycetota bacterium]
MQRSSAVTAGLFLGALAGVVASLLGRIPALREAEHAVVDRLLMVFAEPGKAESSRVKLVLLTDGDRSVDQEEPILVGELLEGLAGRKPAALLLDDRLAGPGFLRDADVGALAAHLAAARRVVLSASAESSSEASAPPPTLPEKDRVEVYGRSDLLPVAASVRLPPEQLMLAAHRIGIAALHPDGETVRSVPVAFRVGAHFVPSLPVAAAMTAFDESSLNIVDDGRMLQGFAGIDLPLDGQANLLLNYRGPRGSFRTIDADRLASAFKHPQEPCDWLDSLSKGVDIVVVSIVPREAPPLHRTPTDPGMSGSEILATALDNIVRGDPLARPGVTLLRFIAVLLGSLAGLLAALSRRLWPALLLCVGLLVLHAATAVLLVHEGLVIDLLPPVAGAVLALPLVRIFLRLSGGDAGRPDAREESS